MKRVGRGKSDTLQSLHRTHTTKKFGEVDFFIPPRQTATVVVDILTEEENFFRPFLDRFTCFGDDQIGRNRYLISTGFGNDAKRTLLIASDRDIDIGFIGAAAKIFESKLRFIIIDFDFNRFITVQYIGNLRDISGTENKVHIGSPLDNLFPQMRRRTSAHTDFSVRFFEFVKNTEFGEEFVYRFFTDGTGIDEDEIGSACIISEFIPLMGVKFRDHVLRITRIHRASKRLDKKFLTHSDYKICTSYMYSFAESPNFTSRKI